MDKNQIFITSGTEYKRMTKELLEKADLQSHIGDRKKKIGIKPNLVSPSEASWGATTHPEVVAGIIEYLKEHGFREGRLYIRHPKVRFRPAGVRHILPRVYP